MGPLTSTIVWAVGLLIPPVGPGAGPPCWASPVPLQDVLSDGGERFVNVGAVTVALDRGEGQPRLGVEQVLESLG
jgi:hypothetical protein